MLSLKLNWRLLSIDDPTWAQVVQVIEESKKKGCAVTIYNNAAGDPGVDSLMLEIDEDTGIFQPVLFLNPTGMRVFENVNGSEEIVEFNGSDTVTGIVTDDMATVLRLAREFYETGDVKEMKGWDELFFNIKKD